MINQIEDGMGFSGYVETRQESSAEDAFQREREACDRLVKQVERLQRGIDEVYTLLYPLENQVVPSILTIREAVSKLRRLNQLV